MRLIMLLANMSVLLLVVGAGVLVYYQGIEFGLGALFGILVYQLAHKSRYGTWFDIN